MSSSEKLLRNYNTAVNDSEELKRYALRIERFLERDERERQDDIQTLRVKQKRLADLFADPFPQVFYSSILIANCIQLEQHLVGIAEVVSKSANRQLALDDLRGSLIERFRKYSRDVLHLEFGLSEADWEVVANIFRLRNCLIHAGARVRSPEVRDFAKRRNIEIEGDRIWLDRDNIIHLIDDTWHFIEAVYFAALGRCPGDS